MIPFIYGIRESLSKFKNNDELIVDGNLSLVYLNPDKLTIKEYLEKEKLNFEKLKALSSFKDKEATTKDGTPISIVANIGFPSETSIALEQGAEGIGLFRSEFLFLNNSDMSEETQFEAYKQALKTMNTKVVTIRTTEFGADRTSCV